MFTFAFVAMIVFAVMSCLSVVLSPLTNSKRGPLTDAQLALSGVLNLIFVFVYVVAAIALWRVR